MEERDYEIDLRELYEIVKKRFWLLAAMMLLAAGASAAATRWFVIPVYESATTLIVVKEQELEQTIQYNDVILSQKLVKTYGEIVKSRTVAKAVIDNLDLDLSAGKLIEMTTVNPVKDTEIISITVTGTDPAAITRIANELATVFMEQIVDIMRIDNVQVIDPAEKPAAPVRPRPLMNVAIAAVLGLMAGLGLVFLVEFMDNTVKTVEDVEKRLGLPVIGIIPLVERKVLEELDIPDQEEEVRA